MRKPKYRHQKLRNLGFVVHEKRRIYLPGKYKSAESIRAYYAFLAKHYQLIADRSKAAPEKLVSINLSELLVAFMDYAQNYYPVNSDGGGEYHNIRCAVRLFLDFNEDGPVELYTASRFKAWQKHLVSIGKYRSGINSMMGKLRRCFRWGVTEGLVSETVYGALCAVEPLKAGRSGAKEGGKKQPVPLADFEEVRQNVKPYVADMLELQWLTGVRPGSVLHAKPCQFHKDANDPDLILWHPKHKMEYRGQKLIVPLGPKAKAIYLKYAAICAGLNDYLFSPKRYKNSKSKRSKFTIFSYDGRVAWAIRKINKLREKDEKELMKHWSPHQIRHARGHEVRNKHGIEAAQAILGHESLNSTEIYSARRLDLAKQIAKESG